MAIEWGAASTTSHQAGPVERKSDLFSQGSNMLPALRKS
jgi:hypothetical protein